MGVEHYDNWLAAQEDAHMEREKRMAEAEDAAEDADNEPEPDWTPTCDWRITELHIPLVVPGWANWLCVSPEGAVWAYENKPIITAHGWSLDLDNPDDFRRAWVCEASWWWVDTVAVPDVYANWKTMLYEVKARA